MSLSLTAVLPLGCALLSALIVAVLVAFADRWSLIDVPNERSSHARPTPRGGGAGIVVAVLGAVVVLVAEGLLAAPTALALAAGAAVAVVGLLDDRRGLTPATRMAVHALAAAASVYCLVYAAGNVPAMGLHVAVAWLPAVALLAIISATNVFNFMDGIDGLAAAEAVYFCAAALAIGHDVPGAPVWAPLWGCLAASTLGFAWFNWPPARIFMGDVGSGFLGFVLAVTALAVSLTSAMPLEVWVILGGAFLVDAALTLLRRLLRRERWYAAHRIHAYQHLSRRWRSHRAVTLAALGINIAWLLPWAWVAANHPQRALACVLAALLPLAALLWAAGAGRPE